jgi:hypothetical protein
MRVAPVSLALSLLLAAAPAWAQSGYYYDGGPPYGFEYYPPPRGYMGYGPLYHDPWRPHYWQAAPAWRPGAATPGAVGAPSGQAGAAGGQGAPAGQNAVTAVTPGQIKSSLEASGFKNVSVVPQAFLIRATAPDGSRIVMQVSPDAVYGVVGAAADQAGSSATGGASSGGSGSPSATGGSGSPSATGASSSSGTGTGGDRPTGR